MDENYLDSLLDEVALDKDIDYGIEEELDNQLASEKRQHQEENAVSMDDLFNMDLEKDADDSLFDNDLSFSENQIDELDQLDNLADLDMDDLDFDDIDFDDLDMTKLGDIEDGNIDNLLKDFEGDLQIADSFDGQTAEQSEDMLSDVETAAPEQEEAAPQEDLNEDTFDTDEFLNSLLGEEPENAEETIPEMKETENSVSEMEEQIEEEMEMAQETESVTEEVTEPITESEDELSLDELLAESLQFEEELEDVLKEDTAPSEEPQQEPQQELQQESSGDGDVDDTELPEMDSLEDLFSMLDLEDPEESPASPDVAETNDDTKPDVDSILDDIEEEEVPKAEKKKKGLMEILFGEPDEEDELSEEELAAIEAKKEAKKAKKQAAKDAKKEKAEAAKSEKAFKDGQKKKENEEKKRFKAEKKAKKKAEEKANAEPEKPLNRPMVVFVFSLFLGGTALFYLASNNFNYVLAIENATEYFSNQKYHNAYDEIKGVDVRDKDQELKDRIYTVMYVERLYESYQNNMELGRQEKALDSLLRGVDKYYEHYDEAVELGISSDLDYSFNQIRTILETEYGITVEQALAINDLENYDYVQTIASYMPEEEVVQ